MSKTVGHRTLGFIAASESVINMHVLNSGLHEVQLYTLCTDYSRTSEQRTHWERVFCPLFGGCPYLGGSIV